MNLQFRVLAVIAVLAAGAVSTGVSHPTSATRSGRTIILSPSGASFDVPKDWVDWFQQFHDNFHLRAKELARVKDGSGEWDTEYAEVVNSVLPFESCMAHVGGEGWGKNGSSFGDVQMRLYQTALGEGEIHRMASAKGLEIAQKIAKGALLSPTVTIGAWKLTTISYVLWYGDYGGTARIDFYTRTHRGQTFVLVFMYCTCSISKSGENEEVKSILKSFRFESSAASGSSRN